MSARKPPIYEIWAAAIEQYCLDNSLDYQKLEKMGRSYNNESCYFQYVRSTRKENIVMDCSKPAPVVLIMRVENGEPVFERTEYTRKYLLAEE